MALCTEGVKGTDLVVLRGQNESQPLYTQILNYNPSPQHYNSTHLYLQYMCMRFYMVWETEGLCFEF